MTPRRVLPCSHILTQRFKLLQENESLELQNAELQALLQHYLTAKVGGAGCGRGERGG